MKKQLIFCIGVLSFVTWALIAQNGNNQNFERVPISQFPLLTGSIPTNALFVIAIPGQNNYSILAAPLANGLQALTSNYLVLSNALFLSTNGATELQDGYTFSPVTSSSGSNTYWQDFGQTNPITGRSRVFATLSATNDVVFYGTTNIKKQWQSLSYNVYAAGSPYVRIYIPTNGLALFPTNYGPWIFYPSNVWDVLYLTNGHSFRDSMGTNSFLEHQWTVK